MVTKTSHPIDKPRRVGVFIDGQNITIGCRYAFGHGNLHPLLLARALCGDDELVEVRYVTGIPALDVSPDRHNAERRRHDLMLATDVVVLEKPLRYRWQWDIRDRDLGNPFEHQGEVHQARVKSRNRGQEKGIDVWIALDALTMAARSDLDVIIVATADSDLDLLPDYLRMLPGQAATTMVQARVLGDHQSVRPHVAWDQVVAIDRSVFELARDDFDYSEELDAAEVAAFAAVVGVAKDGLRD